MITYSDIYEAASKERYSEQLQPLSDNFILEVRNYLEEKKQIASKEDSEFSEVIIRTKKQIENAVTLFKELMLRRRKKILNLVLIAAETGISRKDFDNMLDFEKELFESLMENIEKSNGKVSEIMNSKVENLEKIDQTVMFKENVNEFVGLDGKKIGPFKKDEKVKLPKEIVQILVEDKKVEIVEE